MNAVISWCSKTNDLLKVKTLKQCHTCRHYRADGGNIGKCTRYPTWIVKHFNSYCGEWGKL